MDGKVLPTTHESYEMLLPDPMV
ncbi:hypothetical protein LINPERPRIM_LOCUS22244 [Linum perenne]